MLNADLKRDLAKAAERVFTSNYDLLADEGSKLKSLILVLALDKSLKDSSLLPSLVQLLLANLQAIKPQHVLTIMQSLAYNKVVFVPGQTHVLTNQQLLAVLATFEHLPPYDL